MHAYLIVGGSRETRTEKLEEFLSQKGIGKAAGERFNLGGGQKRHSEAPKATKNPDGVLRSAQDDSSLKIEDVREAEEWVSRKRNRAAVMAVEEADRLTLPAQHAFLKTLEEPGDNISVVLTAADGLSLLATIRSRCKIIRLPAAATETVDSEKFRKLLSGSVSQRLGQLYPILKEMTGSGASLHRGAVKRGEAITFVESFIGGLSLRGVPTPGSGRRGNPEETALMLKSAATAHRRLKNNLNPTLVLHQFVMDISGFD